MSPEELRRMCSEGEHVMLVLPRKAPPSGFGVRLLNRTGPGGRNHEREGLSLIHI